MFKIDQEMKQEELRRLGHEREEARKRRQAASSPMDARAFVCNHVQEQEQWEQAMRRKFAEEAALSGSTRRKSA